MNGNIYDAALRYLSSRSRTVFEMRKYLAGKGYDETETEALIAELLSAGYLNDQEYCRRYFSYALSKGKGKRKLYYELREKGVDPSVIEIAFADFTEELLEEGTVFDEKKQALSEAEKILRLSDISQGEPVPERILASIARKLHSRGFESDVIYSVLGELRR